MLNRELTGSEIKALALKYVKGVPAAAGNCELVRDLLENALRKLKAGSLSDFKKVLNYGTANK